MKEEILTVRVMCVKDMDQTLPHRINYKQNPGVSSHYQVMRYKPFTVFLVILNDKSITFKIESKSVIKS